MIRLIGPGGAAKSTLGALLAERPDGKSRVRVVGQFRIADVGGVPECDP